MEFFDGLQFAMWGAQNVTDAAADAKPRFYGVQLLTYGTLKVSIDNAPEKELHAPAMFLTWPQVNFKYYSDAERGHNYVCFCGERAERYVKEGLFVCSPENSMLQLAGNSLLQKEFAELLLLIQSNSKHDLAVAKLEYILLLFQQAEELKGMPGFHQKFVEELMKKIIANPEQNWNFAKEAARINVSLKHFMRIFRKICNTSCHQFVLQQRLNRAAAQLVSSNDPIKEVAWQNGFNDEYYFSRIFKKHYHLAPSDYRKINF